MHVIATAGHVDHGKSTLLRAVTGTDPDRFAEEHRRGLSLDLGFVWTDIPDAGQVAFVDVPGHERFVRTMLAGVGPVTAVVFVVAADEGWMPQSEEHLAAIDALGVTRGLLVVTRADLADPGPAMAAARDRIAASSLGEVPAVAASGVSGEGLPEFRAALAAVIRTLPAPDESADVRLWVDRCFTVHGAGTVVTGTLGAGALAVSGELERSSDGEPVGVRGLQILGEPVSRVAAVARVAVNTRAAGKGRLHRGEALLTPGAWLRTDRVDVAVPAASGELPAEAVAHIGAAAVTVRVRPLGSAAARLRLPERLPLRVGDRLVLRDPGRHRVLGGVDVLDVSPPELRGRGAARARAGELAVGDPAGIVVRHRGFVAERELRAMGLPMVGTALPQGWRADPERWAELAARLPDTVERWCRAHPLQPGIPRGAAIRALRLPDEALLRPLVERAGLAERDGRVTRRGENTQLPEPVERALAELLDDLSREPFAAPDADRLAALGLGHQELAAAIRTGRLVKLADGVVLAAGAEWEAARLLTELPQPFTLSQARRHLCTTRRVAVPLLELLDRTGVTRRNPDDTHELRGK